MGILDRLFGNSEDTAPRAEPGAWGVRNATAPLNEQQALERYRYMLRTAPPETLERAHAEAFAKLNPEQRRTLLSELASSAPESERRAVASTPIDDPEALGRVATRAELRQPGIMERAMGAGGGMGFGASLLSSFAMGFVGSMVANSFFSALAGFGDGGAVGEEQTLANDTADDAALDGGEGFDDGGIDDFEA